MQEKERSNGEHEPVECHILLDMRCSRFYFHKSKKQRMACFDPAGVRSFQLRCTKELQACHADITVLP